MNDEREKEARAKMTEVEMVDERRGERDFIDSEPNREADENGEADEDGYSSDGYSSSEESAYQEIGDASICMRMYTNIASSFSSLRWYARKRGGQRGSKPGRLLHRDNAFNQCSGKIHVSQRADRKTKSEILALYGDDWFHVVLSWPTWKLVLVMMLIYTSNLLFFGGLYVVVDRPGQNCGLSDTPEVGITYQTAFAFSLITSSTIGYGFPASGDPFFHTCPQLVVVVYFQVIVSLLINALVVGLVLQRLGRADSRSHQVVFSDKACIRCIHGHFYFMFQVYDLDRRHPVVEAHVRCYAAFHETDGTNTVHFQTRYMRLQNPNDELGGVLFLSVPCTVVHCIDQWSPLMPPKESRSTWQNANDDFVHNSSNRYVFPGLVLREADSECGYRTGTSCPICGESFPTDQHLLRHIRYMQWEEKMNGGTPLLDKVILTSKFESFEDVTEPSDERYVSDQTKAGLGEQKRKAPLVGLQDTLSSAMDANDETGLGSPKENGSSLSSLPSRPRSERKEGVDRRSKDRASHRSKHQESSNSQSSYLGKSVQAGKPTRVDRMLKYYADLSLPVGHQDVDMNLLPTEVQVVPERDPDRKRKNTTDVFSLFESIEKEKRRSKRGQSPARDGDESASAPGAIDTEGHGSDDDEQLPSSPPLKFRPRTKNVDEFRRAIEDHVESSGIEIIVLVEGIEARSSNTFQARHSYTAENIEFDKFFAPCMHVSDSGHAQINLNSFHQMVPVPSFVSEAIVQSHT